MKATAAARRDTLFAGLARGGALLMGIVNVTPDSFSDGGRFERPEAAIAEAQRHVADGASIIDVGAESTRPGHIPIPPEEERRRLAPSLAALIDSVDVAISIDTTKATIAALALEAGAAIVNDQWGLQGDPAMAEVAASHEAGVALMHNRTTTDPDVDIVDDLRRFFDRSLDIASKAGIDRTRLILDPGIGFGKTKAQNVAALGAGVAALRGYGLPVLVGASRKSLFAALIGAHAVDDRLVGTLAAHLTARSFGAGLFRVHDCAPHRDVFAIETAIRDAARD